MLRKTICKDPKYREQKLINFSGEAKDSNFLGLN